jgi:hypothetical protein
MAANAGAHRIPHCPRERDLIGMTRRSVTRNLAAAHIRLSGPQLIVTNGTKEAAEVAISLVPRVPLSFSRVCHLLAACDP